MSSHPDASSPLPLRLGIAGLGTVGVGVLQVLAAHGELLTRRAGRPLQVTAVSARDRGRDRGVDLDGFAWEESAVALAARADVDVVVELIGGSDGIAKDTVEAALAAGKPVVTANKALLAVHGAALARQAAEAGVPLAYEAAVAGGIPVIKGLREGLAANRMTRVYGILNGTCNYILTEMTQTGRAFEEVLAEAQALGYAEADPATDVDGWDAAHKLALLASLAFGTAVDFQGIHVEGIRSITAEDIAFATELGFKIKLLGVAVDHGRDGVEQRVEPCLVPLDSPIAAIDGVFNAVIADGDFVDRVMLVGRGAGAGPTASAVVADLVDIAAGRQAPMLGVPADSLTPSRTMTVAQRVGSYYARMPVYDRPGVVADIAAILRDHRISIEALLQRGRDPDAEVALVMTTHDTSEADMLAAMSAIAALESLVRPPMVLRIERV